MDERYLLIIDGSSLLSTQYYGNLPREILFAKTAEEKARYYHKIMMTRTGVYTNAVYGFLRVLFKILKENRPTHLAVTWDLTRDTFRREMYKEYKGNRSDTPEPLSSQFALCQDVLRRIGIAEFMDERYEADDFSGSLAKKFESEIPVRILTRDHDYLQLVNDTTYLWLLLSSEEKAAEFRKKYGITENNAPEKAVELTEELVEKEFSVKPCHVNSLKGLMGDSSDNIPGVPGVGPQTAVKLIEKYGTVGALYDAIAGLTPEKEAELKKDWKEELGLSRSPLAYLLKAEEGQMKADESAKLSEKLATIFRDIDLQSLTLDDLQVRIDREKTEEVLTELEIKQLSVDFGEEKAELSILSSYGESEDMAEFYLTVKKLSGEKRLGAAYLPGEGLALAGPSGEGFFFKESFFLTKEVLRDGLNRFHEAGTEFAVFRGKDFYRAFEILPDDVSVMEYLLDPLANDDSPEHVMKAVFTERFQPFSGDPIRRAAEQAFIAFKAYEPLFSRLREQGMDSLYLGIERKTLAALARLEETGILVEKDALHEFGVGLKGKMDALEQEAYALAGESLNLNSPKQLGTVLFEKMGLPAPKKTKTGYSTSAEILEKLRKESPFVEKVLEYRTYSKLYSTYALGLKEFIRPDGRIYGKFHQTVTATGRISSSDPNLQNIPVRTELGREIRRLFVPKAGSVFVDADYSQIELRVLAHLSKDEALIHAYESGTDIHALTASQVFNVPLTEVTGEMRRRAKAVNFGIVYGISAFALSEDLEISRSEAEQYMEKYFETYPGVRAYLKHTVEEAVERGYSETLYGRKRPIPELASSNFNQRSFGERVAMNAPIQGTAADLMKLAVIRVSEALEKGGFHAKMVLQVHDEILIEAPEEEADEAEKLLIREMEGVADLSVPLKAESKKGYTWYDCK